MIKRAGFALISLVLSGSAWGTVTNLRLYKLGEADVPPAIPSGPGDPQTTDSVGGVNASKIGLEFYHFQHGGVGVSAKGIAPGSTEAMDFTNIDSRYVAPAVGGIVNYGLETYVQPAVPGDAQFFYNGGEGPPLFSPPDGMGLGIQAGEYVGIVGGIATIFSGVPAILNQPVEIAIVADSTSTRMFIQGLPVGGVLPRPRGAPAGSVLSMGNFFATQTPPAYDGVLDEARVFTFGPGGFNPGDLGPSTVPEPGVIAMAGAMAVLAVRRRRRE
jgi:hypothetical protein